MTQEAASRGIRLQKILAQAGVCSRRAAESLIQAGRVRVNGRTVTELGVRARPTDRICVDGKDLPLRAEHLYIALHKPVGVVTTARDPEGRPTVLDLVPRRLARVFPVGRLDLKSTGLVLLTNDGVLAAGLMHPRSHVSRTYRVKVDGTPDERLLARLRRGVRLADGHTGPLEVSVERGLPTKTWLRITVHEGRTHLVRRVLAAVGLRVDKLQRTCLGPLRLGSLGPGAFRSLTSAEVRALRQAVAGHPERPRRPVRSSRKDTRVPAP